MKRSVINLSKTEKKFLLSLLKDGSKNDSQIAREISISKATAHRTRKKLEDEELLLDCLPVVNLDKLDINFFAVVMFQWNKFDDEKLTENMIESLKNDPHVVYLAAGDSSLGLTHVIMVAFPDLSAYHSYFQEFRKKYADNLENINSFFIPSEKIIKQDYTGLVEQIFKEMPGESV